MSYRITKACTACGACLPECPTRSIIAGPKHDNLGRAGALPGQFHIDADTCADHAACVNVCPVDGAIVPLATFMPTKKTEERTP